MVIKNNYFNRINGVSVNATAPNVQKPSAAHGSFEKALERAISKDQAVKFSKHAELRLRTREINLSPVQMDKMNQALDKAGRKGVKDSLVLMDDIAFVVNIKNRTVVTALNRGEFKENVFTNIDGAVII
jgi:flagellar operon protein